MNDKNSELEKIYTLAIENQQKGNSEIAEKFYKKILNANCETIPYKFNRAVLFNSDFFHETDKIDFKTGYESRRINITYLFGTRKIKKIN